MIPGYININTAVDVYIMILAHMHMPLKLNEAYWMTAVFFTMKEKYGDTRKTDSKKG